VMQHGPAGPTRAALAAAVARRIPELLAAARGDAAALEHVLEFRSCLSNQHIDASPIAGSRPLLSAAVDVIVGMHDPVDDAAGRDCLRVALGLIGTAASFSAAQVVLSWRSQPRLTAALARHTQSADVGLAGVAMYAAAELGTWDDGHAATYAAAPGALAAVMRRLCNRRAGDDEREARRNAALALAALARYPPLLQLHPATRGGAALDAVCASLCEAPALDVAGLRGHAEALWAMAAWGEEARDRIVGAPGVITALVEAAEAVGDAGDEPLGALASLAAIERVAMAVAGDVRLLPLLARVLYGGGLQSMAQAAALVQRLWSHAGAAAVLAGQHEALVELAASVLQCLGGSAAAPDARGCAIALDAVRRFLPALACLSLVRASQHDSAAASADGDDSVLTSALRSLDAKKQAGATHALAELAGLRRAVPAPPPRFMLPEGWVLLSEAALRVATPAQRAELRGVARQVVAALAGGGGARTESDRSRHAVGGAGTGAGAGALGR